MWKDALASKIRGDVIVLVEHEDGSEVVMELTEFESRFHEALVEADLYSALSNHVGTTESYQAVWDRWHTEGII